MKKNQSFLLGMITMLAIVFITLPLSSFAASNSISATLSDVKIFINNKLLNLEDENGNKLQPIVYNGRTYLPVKSISEAVNLPVTWVANTKSVYVGSNDLDIPATYVSSIDYFYSSYPFTHLSESSAKDNLGDSYESEKTLYSWVGNTEQIYNIDGKYTKLKGTCFIIYDSRNADSESYAKIYGDNELLWSGSFKAGVMPIDFTLDISGYNQLKFVINEPSIMYSADISFANLGLYP